MVGFGANICKLINSATKLMIALLKVQGALGRLSLGHLGWCLRSVEDLPVVPVYKDHASCDNGYISDMLVEALCNARAVDGALRRGAMASYASTQISNAIDTGSGE